MIAKPYVKKYDQNGFLLNPLPYYHQPHQSRQVRRGNHRVVYSHAADAFVLERRIKSASNSINRDKSGQKWIRI